MADHPQGLCGGHARVARSFGILKRPAIHAEKMQIAGLAYERRDDAIEVGDVVIAVDDAAAVHQMFNARSSIKSRLIVPPRW
jgi:hypothetical protein